MLDLCQFPAVVERAVDGWTRVKQVVGVNHVSNPLLIVI